ncbi:hypothetical protein B0T20DRAFT_350660 [Sordaria brevicollis]|uniref:Uncharacterized protein n=1 Tax=Sordaria brevicollis TaxID=83679 RepID=A0AAE0UD26_SORBR|nr:hypothetical protein B0T20DRAFT_350660 [Sordaria brevicollis]
MADTTNDVHDGKKAIVDKDLIESRIDKALTKVQDLPQLLQRTSTTNTVLTGIWFKILEHIFDNLVEPDETFRDLDDFQFDMIPSHARPQHAEFIKLAYRWMVTMHCAGVAEQAFANLGQYKPSLKADVLAVVAPHEPFWLRKGALHTVTQHHDADDHVHHTNEQKIRYVRELLQAMTNMVGIADKPSHHHVLAVKAMSGAVLEEACWDVYINARDAQQGVTPVLPWTTNFCWGNYETFDDRWADIVDHFNENKSAVANLMQATYVQRYTSDPYKESQRKKGQKKNNDSRAVRYTAAVQAAQHLQAIQGAAAVPAFPATPAAGPSIQGPPQTIPLLEPTVESSMAPTFRG